jgi:glucose-6-phosphate isomerase
MADSASSPAIAATELSLGPGQAAYDEAAGRARDEGWARLLFDRDPTLWSKNERVQAAIADRLGWLDSPRHFTTQIGALEAFGEAIRDAGFTAAVVGGMGGSSLAPEVFREVFGSAEGWLDLRVLDSTDPAAVAAITDDLDPLSTLWIVASKSGTTTEPLAFQAYQWDRAERALREHGARVFEHPGELMVAITDPGKSLEAIPHHDDLREVFLNPPDIGGRYSAISYVGLVPASLIGIDLDPLLESANAMLEACTATEPNDNPGVSLGLAIGALAKNGRDKLTLLADPSIASLGAWLEQLLAESTGKQGTGIVPVDREPVGEIAAYGDDRVFVRIALAGGDDWTAGDAFVDAAAAAGHPVIRLQLADPIDLGGEMVRWEVATAIAGAVLGIDPFDQPNVEEAKELTRKVLAGASSGETAAPPPAPLVADDEAGLALHGDAPMRLTAGDGTLVGELARHLARRKPNAYLAIQAFIAPSDAATESMNRIRSILRDATRNATTAGYGPRFLHSTGQLHKGGPSTGWFLQLTSDHPADRPIPGWPYTFGRLIDAQAEGDFAAIEAHDLPILRVHLRDPERGLAALEGALRDALARA